MSAVLDMGKDSHPWAGAQGSQGQKLLLSAHSWAHFTRGETEALGLHGH